MRVGERYGLGVEGGCSVIGAYVCPGRRRLGAPSIPPAGNFVRVFISCLTLCVFRACSRRRPQGPCSGVLSIGVPELASSNFNWWLNLSLPGELLLVFWYTVHAHYPMVVPLLSG